MPVGPDTRPRRMILVCAVAVVAGAAGMLALVYPSHKNDEEPTLAERMVFPDPPEPSAAVSVLPAPTTAVAATGGDGVQPGDGGTQHGRTGGVVTRTTAVSTSLPGHPTKPTGVTHTFSPTPVLVDLTVGATVGLELADRPGFRLRHRNFLGRVDPISATSSTLDKADSGFAVRRGLGQSGCYSLESLNYPGYYLRHRNFVLRLDRRDGSRLFDQDATFCTVPAGTAVTLQSINYPDRSLRLESDRLVHLDQGQGTSFKVRPAL